MGHSSEELPEVLQKGISSKHNWIPEIQQAKDETKRKEIYVLASDIEFVQSSNDGSNSKPRNEGITESTASPKAVYSGESVSEEDLETVPF